MIHVIYLAIIAILLVIIAFLILGTHHLYRNYGQVRGAFHSLNDTVEKAMNVIDSLAEALSRKKEPEPPISDEEQRHISSVIEDVFEKWGIEK